MSGEKPATFAELLEDEEVCLGCPRSISKCECGDQEDELLVAIDNNDPKEEQ